MTGAEPAERLERLADEVRRLLDEVLEQAQGREWHAAARRSAALVEASRLLQDEADYRSMSVWLDRARTA